MASRLILCLALMGAVYLPFGASQAPVKHPPLITTCQVMQQVIMDVQTALNATGSGISCRLSTNCTQVQCRRPTHGYPIFMLEIQACNDPVTLKIVRFNDTRGRIAHESVIEMSSMIGVDLGYGFVILNFTLAQRRTRLSLGLKVDTVDLAQTSSTPFISQQDIPIDLYSCPGNVRPQSETCQVTENIAQYLNYFFGSVLQLDINTLSPDCIPSTSCNDIVCHLAQGGYYQYSLLSCESPPALRLVSVLSNGTVYFEHITITSEMFPLPPMPTITLNITFSEISSSTVGFGLGFTDSNTGRSYTEVPYVEVPLNKSKCVTKYTNAPLVSACDILPRLSSPQCTPVLPNCSQATCQIYRLHLNATVDVKLYNCFSPPAIGIIARDGVGVFISDRSSNSKVLTNPRDGSQLELTVVQHISEMSVGVQLTSLATNETYIGYQELPVNRSSCQEGVVPHPTTLTCETMSYVAQFLTIFYANVTNDRESTPDCRTIEPDCNNITCTFPDWSYYNLDILPCVSPPVLHLEFHAPNGTAIAKHTFNPGTQTERIDEHTQVKVTLGNAPDVITLEVIAMYNDGSYSFSLPAIPNVLIPLDTSGCKQVPPRPTDQVVTNEPTTKKSGIPQTTLLAIEVAAPAGGLLLLIICVMCCVIAGLCIRQSRLKHIRDNYNFQRLSIAAQDYDDAEDDEEEEGEVRQK